MDIHKRGCEGEGWINSTVNRDQSQTLYERANEPSRSIKGRGPMELVSTKYSGYGYNKEEVEDNCLLRKRKEYEEAAVGSSITVA
jgi:hypothetical protein